MPRLASILAFLRLIRLEQALPVVSGSWLMAVLAVHLEPASFRNAFIDAHGLPLTMLLGSCVSVGMSIHALTMNDALDLRRDRALHVGRPLATGSLSLTTAIVVMILSLIVAVAAAVMLGRLSTLVTLAAMAGIVIYNTAGKFMPAAGIVLLGLIFALNMLVVNPAAGFVWPVWLCMSHVMIAATAVYALQGKRPRLRLIDLGGIVAGWLFWTMALFAVMEIRDTTSRYETPWVWLGPGAAAAIYLSLTIWSLKPGWNNLPARPHATRNYAAIALWSLMLFDAGWLAAMGMWGFGGLVLCLLGLAMLLGPLLRWLEAIATSPQTAYLLREEDGPEMRE